MADTTVLNADVRTARRGGRPAESIAWREGKIVAIGTRAEVRAVAGKAVIEHDLGSRTVTPGFIDAHHHAGIAALYGVGSRVRLEAPAVTDIPSLQRALAEAASQTPQGRWVVAGGWNEAALRERRAPTRSELDDATPDHPLLAMHYSFHRAVANSRALELAGLSRRSPEPRGGSIGRGRNRDLNGLLIERGMSGVEALARADAVVHDAEEVVQRLGEHERALLGVGITRIADAAVPSDLLAIYELAHQRGIARIPTMVMPVSIRGWLEEPEDLLASDPPSPRAATLTLGPLKMIFDGAHSCAMCLKVWQSAVVSLRTAAMALREGTLDPVRVALSLSPRFSGGSVRTGVLLYGAQEAKSTVSRALERGFSVATHAEGNEAVDVVLGAYEANGTRLHTYGRARIEHGIFLTRTNIERLAGVGAALVVQPAFLGLPEFTHAPPIPGIDVKPLRALLEAGVLLAGSSDFPVVSFDPILGIRRAMHRPHVDPDQAISFDEALGLYTRSAAEVLGQGDICGTLEVGKRADLAIFDRRLDERSVHEASVVATVLNGDVAHGCLARLSPASQSGAA